MFWIARKSIRWEKGAGVNGNNTNINPDTGKKCNCKAKRREKVWGTITENMKVSSGFLAEWETGRKIKRKTGKGGKLSSFLRKLKLLFFSMKWESILFFYQFLLCNWDFSPYIVNIKLFLISEGLVVWCAQMKLSHAEQSLQHEQPVQVVVHTDPQPASRQPRCQGAWLGGWARRLSCVTPLQQAVCRGLAATRQRGNVHFVSHPCDWCQAAHSLVAEVNVFDYYKYLRALVILLFPGIPLIFQDPVF